MVWLVARVRFKQTPNDTYLQHSFSLPMSHLFAGTDDSLNIFQHVSVLYVPHLSTGCFTILLYMGFVVPVFFHKTFLGDPLLLPWEDDTASDDICLNASWHHALVPKSCDTESLASIFQVIQLPYWPFPLPHLQTRWSSIHLQLKKCVTESPKFNHPSLCSGTDAWHLKKSQCIVCSLWNVISKALRLESHAAELLALQMTWQTNYVPSFFKTNSRKLRHQQYLSGVMSSWVVVALQNWQMKTKQHVAT